MMDKPRIHVDASALKAIACTRHLIWTVRDGYTGTKNSSLNHKMEYGSAGHHYFAGFYRNIEVDKNFRHNIGLMEASKYWQGRVEQGMIVGDDWRTQEHLIRTLCAYPSAYSIHDFKPLVVNDEAFIELQFDYPWFETSKYSVHLVGTVDMVAEFYGQLHLVDHKFTASTQIPKFFREFAHSTQLLFYNVVLEMLGDLYEVGDRFKNLPAMINGVFLRRGGGSQFVRSESFNFDEGLREDFRTQLEVFKHKLAHHLDSDDLPPGDGLLHDACKGTYSPCAFMPVCGAPNRLRKKYLENQYHQRAYDPFLWGSLEDKKPPLTVNNK